MAAFWLAYYTGKRILRTRTLFALLLLAPILGTSLRTVLPSVWGTLWLCVVWVMSALFAAGVMWHIESVDAATGMADVIDVSVVKPWVHMWAHTILFAALLGGQLIISTMIVMIARV